MRASCESGHTMMNDENICSECTKSKEFLFRFAMVGVLWTYHVCVVEQWLHVSMSTKDRLR